MERRSEELWSRLSCEFDSALASEDERAAGDLARSLSSGRDVRSLLGGGSRVLLPVGGAVEVAVLGVDHCSCGDQGTWLVPLTTAEVVVDDGRRPQPSSERLLPVLRRLASRRPQVEVFAVTGRRAGVLLGAGADHLRLETTAGVLALPISELRAVRLAREG